MIPRIDVRSDIDRLVAQLRARGSSQLPYATAVAVTRTAQIVREALKTEMPRAFDRPTPWTMNSLYLKAATKQLPVATVWLKDFAPKGNPAARYLLPEIVGGERRVKPFERRLRYGRFAVPGEAAPLDQYGNVKSGELERILSALGAAGGSGYDANRTRASARRKGRNLAEYFVGSPGGAPEGVWRRYRFALGSAVKPILIFVRPPRYQKRYRFQEIATETIAREFPANFERAFREAIAGAR